MLSTASRSENQLTVRDTAASQSTAGSQPMSVFAREMSAGVPRMSPSRLGTANVTTGRTRTLRSALVFSTDLASPSGQPHPRVVRPRTRLRWSATTAEEAETMRDRELYATILGVTAPWTVDRVDLDVAGGAVHVWLARTEGAPAQCPECQSPCTIYDHRDREWRHLDTCQLQTRLHARVPRVDCPTHGAPAASPCRGALPDCALRCSPPSCRC
ncbi:MAG: transposase family protein [Deltaproteobacteria bacterium]|nr:MAG: transposase family protein [Deltaproteobacteria bacterium]